MSWFIDHKNCVSIRMLSLRTIFRPLYKELGEPAVSFQFLNSMKKGSGCNRFFCCALFYISAVINHLIHRHDWDKCCMLGDGVLKLQTIANWIENSQMLDATVVATLWYDPKAIKNVCVKYWTHITRCILIVLVCSISYCYSSQLKLNITFFYLRPLSEQIWWVYKVLKLFLYPVMMETMRHTK
jgi:hypothetical protein